MGREARVPRIPRPKARTRESRIWTREDVQRAVLPQKEEDRVIEIGSGSESGGMADTVDSKPTGRKTP